MRQHNQLSCGWLVYPMAAGSLLSLASCFDELRSFGPGVELLTPDSSLEVGLGQSANVVVQVLDVNGLGVNDAYVTYTRSDASRLTWVDAPPKSYAATYKTEFSRAGGVNADGVASASVMVPPGAAPGNADVVIVLKEPAEPDSAIAVRVTIQVVPGEDAGVRSVPYGAATDESGGADADADQQGSP